MSNAGNTPNFTAASTVQPFSCVKVNTTSGFQANPATDEADVVVGITDGSSRLFDSSAAAISGGVLSLQNGQFVQLTAGGTITVGDGLRPNSTGTVVTAASRAQFVACESAASGEVFWGKKIGAVETGATIPGFYGSRRAGEMLRDAIAGTDAIDVITIGDSNAMYAGANGYHMGWNRMLQFGLRIKPYGTSLFPGGAWNVGNPSTAVGTQVNAAGIGFNSGSNAQGSAGGSNSPNTGKMIATNTDTNIVGLRNWLGMSVSDLTNSTANSLLFPNGNGQNPAVVETSARFTSQYDNNVHVSNQTQSGYTSFGLESTFGTNGNGAGVTLTYRLVYGTFPTAGNFRPVWYWLPGGQVGKRETGDTTTGGGYGYATQSYTYAPTFNDSDQRGLRVAWDGYNSATAAHQTTGPFAALWQSVINTAIRGYSVSNLNYYGGASMTEIATKITGADKLLDAFLKEIRERQIACGGTGKAIVFLNAGVNIGANAWIVDAQTIVTRMKERWVSSGGNASNLAFVFTVTHPKTIGSWSTARAAVSTAANAWGQSAGDNVCVVDIGAMIDGPTLVKYLLYQDSTTDGGQSHLASVAVPPATGTMAGDGYQIITEKIVSTLLASA